MAEVQTIDNRITTAARMIPGPAWVMGADGALEWVNEAMLAILGQTAAALVGRPFAKLLHPDSRDDYDFAWHSAVAAHVCIGHAKSGFKGRVATADGGWRWLLIHAAPAEPARGSGGPWIGTAADIDAEVTSVDALTRDNEELEQDLFTRLHELNRSRSHLQTIFDACPDYLYLIRLKAGVLAYEDVNPAAQALFDVDRSKVAGRPVAEVVGVESAASIETHVRRALRGTRVQYQVERRTGAPITVQIVGAPIAYSNEEEGLVLFCGRDITEQRAAEDALRQSQKMEAVGQLTGGLAHDFNNLLTGIMGSLDLLQVRVAQGRYDRVERYVDAAQEAAKRAAALTHRLLAFSRRQTLDPKPANINTLVAGMLDLLRRTVGPEILLETTQADDLWIVLVDVSQLENALLNLCINARDAMPDGGRIDVEMRNTRLSASTAGERDLPLGDYVALSVSDNGTGMPPEVAARIFDPFFTTKPLGSGTGLGLSMIYGFARQSGGNVRVHTRPGIGTTMRILLPRHYGEAEHEVESGGLSDAPRSSQGESILLIDDEHAVRSLAAEVLDELGYRIVMAADGNEGLERLRSKTRFDVLITDVGLPGGLNGRQVADAARLLRPGIKVLFITGYAENAVLNHGHLAAGMQVLTKPFAMETLASRVKQLIEQP